MNEHCSSTEVGIRSELVPVVNTFKSKIGEIPQVTSRVAFVQKEGGGIFYFVVDTGDETVWDRIADIEF